MFERNRKYTRRDFALYLALALAAPIAAFAAKPGPSASYAYTLKQLNPPVGAVSASASGLNEQGVVVGQADFPNYEWAGCIWQPNGQIAVLPLLPTAQVKRARASSITDDGRLISGSSVTYVGGTSIYWDNFRATYWQIQDGGFQARDWNDLMGQEHDLHLIRGNITSDGNYAVFEGTERATGLDVTVIAAIVYSGATVAGLEILDTLAGTLPQDIKHDGSGVVRVLAGTVGRGGSYLLWKMEGDQIHPIKLSPHAENPEPLRGGLNRHGQVVSTRRIDLYKSSALLWNESDVWDLSKARNLGTFGGTSARAAAINDAGQIVGTAATGGKQQDRAFLFQNGNLIDLNLVAPVGKLILRSAYRVSNTGHILISAQATGSSYVSVLLVPVP